MKATGQQLINILEDSVSMYPALEGRFPQVSGIKFKFDAQKPKYERVIASSIEILGKKFDLEEVYAVATVDYLSSGKDGYKSFLDCEYLIDPDVCPCLEDVLQRFFSYPKEFKYIEEYNVFFSQKEFITRERIRDAINGKLKRQDDIFEEMENFEIEEADGEIVLEEFSVFNKEPALIRSSFSIDSKRSKESKGSNEERNEGGNVVQVLNRHNVRAVVEGVMGISIECMTRYFFSSSCLIFSSRLRMYCLSSGFCEIDGEDQNLVFKIAPVVENRIGIVNKEHHEE